MNNIHQALSSDGDVTALTGHYREWASTYDEEILGNGWVSALQTALLGAQTCGPTGTPDVLDVGCGTGLVGVALHRLVAGAHITGVDLSPEMVAEAEKTGDYDVLHASVDLNQELPEQWRESFDIVVSSGTFTNGHVGPECLTWLVEACRPGGTIAFSVRRNHSLSEDYAGTVGRLEQEHGLQVTSRLDNAPYMTGEEGADYWVLAKA